MELYIPRPDLQAEIHLPASKSISNRVLILNALSYSPYDIENLSDSDDTRVLAQVFDSNDTHFDIGAAGTSMRFLTAFLAKTVGEWTITGSERMKQRPIRILVDALNALGGKIEYMEKTGYPPLRIFGSALTGGHIELDGGVSSQYISALMMIAPYMQNGLHIELKGTVISRPYIHMTAGLMEAFGVSTRLTSGSIDIQPQTYRPIPFRVESDWSAASYWYELLSIAGQGTLFLHGLQKNSLQGDCRVAELFGKLGVNTEYTPAGIRLTPNGAPLPDDMQCNLADQPDLAQTLVVTCCLKGIPFLFTGLQSLKIKETDRIAALIAELRKLGYVLHEPMEGALGWDGTRCADEAHPSIATYEDHRMAMSFAPAAITRPIDIQHPEVVSKSYPAFWQDLESISSSSK